MKVERKKGLKNVKVTHNKSVFWSIVVLFIILIAVVIAIRTIGNKDNGAIPEGAECAGDNDCAIVSTTQCPCNMGGTDACIAESEASKYDFSGDSNTEKGELVCAAVYNCKIKSCSCVEGKCTGIEGE